jgi:hypothetical protein
VVCEKSQVCNAGVCGAPQGVTKFSVNFVTEDVSMGALQNQRYADRFGVPPNLTNSTMTIRIYAPGATGGSINIYFSDGDFTAGNGIIVALSALAAGWNDVNVPIPPASGNFDPAVINQVNLEVTSQGGGPFTIPTIVYIDGIRTSNLLVNDTFDASLGSTNGTMVMSTQQAIAGSTLSWLTAIP